MNYKPEPNKAEEQEQLRLENELLKIKMQAEFGAVFGETNAALPPEMEHAFLQSILAVEEQYQNRKTIKVYDLIGRPAFQPADSLQPEEVEAEVKRLLLHMRDKKINLHVQGKYPFLVLYKFITEELFEFETDDLQVEGFTQEFIYEEFHPNHKADIEEATMRFLKNWFDRDLERNFFLLDEQLLLPDSKVPAFLTKKEVLEKMKLIFAAYVKFKDCKYILADVGFQWDEKESRGFGHGEGAVKYTALLEDGTEQEMEGPFKIYFSNQYGAWLVMHFIFPGFNWS
jgi:hypothetical protein